MVESVSASDDFVDLYSSTDKYPSDCGKDAMMVKERRSVHEMPHSTSVVQKKHRPECNKKLKGEGQTQSLA